MKIDDRTVTTLLKQELKDFLLSPMQEQHPNPSVCNGMWLCNVRVAHLVWNPFFCRTLPCGIRDRLRPVGSGRSSCHSKNHGRMGQGCPSRDMGAELGSLPRRAGLQDGHTIPAAPAQGMVPPQGDDLPATTEDSPVRL